MHGLDCCCAPVTGGSAPPGECCSLEDTLSVGNVTGGSDIVITTADRIRGQTDLILQADAGDAIVAASADVILQPTGGAFVGTDPIVTGGVSLGGTGAVFEGQTAPGPNGTNLRFRGLTAGANVTLTVNANDIVIASSGGAAADWATVLAVGNITGGTNPVISTGDSIDGEFELDLNAGGNAGPVEINAADGNAGTTTGGQVRIDAGSGSGGADGGQWLANGGIGNGPGSGGRLWAKGGLGGPTNGQGGVGRFSGGDGSAAGDGGAGVFEGGTGGGGGGQGGPARVIGGPSDGFPGEVQIRGGDNTNNGPGANVTIRGGIPQSTGPAQVGGSVQLLPQAGVAGGANGTATVGTETIITTCSSAGGGVSVVRSKTAATINGADQTFRSLTSTNGSVTIVQNADTADFSITAQGSEIQLFVSGGTGLVGFTLRQTTVRGRQSMQTQMVLNIAAGTLDVELRWRSLVNLTTSSARARHMWGRSNLGNTASANATALTTTTSSTFALMNSMTMNLNAGEWVITAGCDLAPPN